MDPRPFENELTYQTHEREGTLESFHESFEAAVESVRADLGRFHPHRIEESDVESESSAAGQESTITVRAPGDLTLEIGEFAAGDETTVDRAVETAAGAFEEWSKTEYTTRVEIFREAAEIVRDRKFDLAATISLENGKNRTEAMADVDEAIDFLRFYARELERHEGYRFDTGRPTPREDTENLLRPYGVFAVIPPFNFPLAILSGMTTGALITGNTVVLKPASATPLIAHEFYDVLSDAGLPDGVLTLVTGSGRAVGTPLVEHDSVAGVAFTGSRSVGVEIQRTFLELGKRGPVIAELGGKNPVIVTDAADIERAVSGVAMGAFSFSGQKCSATSRVYVHEDVMAAFTERLVAVTESLTVGPPWDRDTVVSPVIDDDALSRYEEIVATARETGTVLTGGSTRESASLPRGRYVEPTVVADVPHGHVLAREEHFLPFLTIHPVTDLDEAIRKANDSEYGLCAGIFSEDDREVETWFEEIESGMCYANRDTSATTGALVQAQPFGGWKFSGTTGAFAGGYWYLPQFMREQSRTRVEAP